MSYKWLFSVFFTPTYKSPPKSFFNFVSTVTFFTKQENVSLTVDGSKIGMFVITIASVNDFCDILSHILNCSVTGSESLSPGFLLFFTDMILFIVNTCVNDFCDILSHILNCSGTGSESLSPGFLLFFTDLLCL